jgi:hypothetical protein
LGKQLYRLPNNNINAITDVGQMKRAQPTALMGFANAKKTPLVKPTYCSPNSSVNLVTDVGQMKRAQPTRWECQAGQIIVC